MTAVVLTEGHGRTLWLIRARHGPMRVESALVDAGHLLGNAGHFRLVPAEGWEAKPTGPHRWSVWPLRFDPNRPAHFAVERVEAGGPGTSRRACVVVHTEIDITSDFDPLESALLVRNRASELGEYRPQRDVFDATWPRMARPFARLLFDGLYSDVVFLSSGPKRGGLCSGMARWAIARALGEEPPPASREAAIQRIAHFHGRQLRDRALLSALPWFLRGSPSAAFRVVRRDLVRQGISDRALDLAIPKLWRRDVFSALVEEGHTVVPIRLRQHGSSRGSLEVYDPNRPDAVTSGEPRVIAFDLERDHYAYGTLVDMEQSNVGIIAVRQPAYAESGTAVLATIGSFLLAPRRGLRSLLAKVDSGG